MRFAFSMLALSVMLAGCAVSGAGETEPALVLPQQWHQAALPSTGEQVRLAQWWLNFNDPTLDQLIQQALVANTDLATAQAQLRQARAARLQTSAALGPAVTVSAGKTRQWSDTGSSGLYSADFDASWEPDLFGALGKAEQASIADEKASAEALRDVQVSLIAELALNYVELRTTQQQLLLARATVQTQQQTYQLTRWQAQAGLVAQLDELQAKTELQSRQAELPSLENTAQQSRHRIDVLTGKAAGSGNWPAQTQETIPVASAAVSLGIPADLLRQRPDVRQAQRQVQAQLARLEQAQAARYPSLSLSGSLGVQASGFQQLTDAGDTLRSLIANLAMPVFDSGRISAAIEAEDAALQQSRLNYQSTVLLALEEVENALSSLHSSQQLQLHLAEAVDAAQQAEQLARYNYQAGLTGLATLLDSQRTLFSLQQQQLSATSDLATAQIQLFKALGGGWSLPQNTADSENTL